MMKRKITLLWLLFVLFLFVSQSFILSTEAQKEPVAMPQSNCGITKISKFNSKESHFFGLNCMSCHRDGRAGKGCFTIAGSVLDEDRSHIHKNPVIKLTTEPRGAGRVVATVQGDAFGNFYTTEKIDFGTGLYATLIGSPGAKEPVKYMTRKVISGMGRCNQCHGYQEEALGID